jgi:hypothetical protein
VLVLLHTRRTQLDLFEKVVPELADDPRHVKDHAAPLLKVKKGADPVVSRNGRSAAQAGGSGTGGNRFGRSWTDAKRTFVIENPKSGVYCALKLAFGRLLAQFCKLRPRRPQESIGINGRNSLPGIVGSGGGIRTPDTGIMIPLLWPTELLRPETVLTRPF